MKEVPPAPGPPAEKPGQCAKGAQCEPRESQGLRDILEVSSLRSVDMVTKGSQIDGMKYIAIL